MQRSELGGNQVRIVSDVAKPIACCNRELRRIVQPRIVERSLSSPRRSKFCGECPETAALERSRLGGVRFDNAGIGHFTRCGRRDRPIVSALNGHNGVEPLLPAAALPPPKKVANALPA
jgi:hypothetical protein